jgi:membrane-bound lytic murein transglycosylase D
VKSRFLVILALCLSAACASTNSSQSAARGAQTPAPVASARCALCAASSDLSDLNRELNDAYSQIVARESKPVVPQPVDVEAAASMAIPDHKLVRGAVSLFSSTLKSDIQTYLTRSARYKKMIERTLTEAGLPKGLAYLPVIESGYSMTMTSRAGARGMWQFMSDTAREYGLRVDWWVDERADPERSTRAAAQYMKDLYRNFNDWPLALAAYNGGPGRIRRALAETGGTTFWDLCEAGAIPKETRGYVPTFYATLLIASDPASYGFHLTKPDDTDLARVDVAGPLSLKYLAQVAAVDADLLRDLNPSLRHGIVPPGRTSLRVPAKSADAITARAATLRGEDTDITVCSYTMREGDSLKRLARAVGVDVDTLLSMNDLRSPSRVGEGDSIYLPVRARELGTLLNAEATYYAVQKGDTLYSIAKKYDLTVDELRDLNDLGRAEKLRHGQKLRVNATRTLTAGGM